MSKNRLHIKIFILLFTAVAVISSMAAILVHERMRIKEIEYEAAEIRQVRRDINAAHRHITRLATLGESVIGWEGADSTRYRILRQHTDSLLQALKPYCRDYVRPAQIDTLCTLLAEKEAHLLHLTEILARQDEADSLLVNHLPEVARRATRVRTIEQKKKGIAGAFGGKKTVQVLPSAKELHQFSDSLIALQQRQTAEMDAYADSLRNRNRALNRELNRLVSDLDTQAQTAFGHRERKIAEAQALSVRLFTITISAAIVLLFLSYLAIHREMKRNDHERKKMRHLLDEYNELLEMYKRTILTVSHDIRGPLNVINNYVKWAMAAKSKKTRDIYLRNVRHSYNHILHLVNNLLDVYRLNESKEIRNDIPFRLASLLERVAEEYTLPANNKGLLFDKDLKGMDVTVKGDADRLEQVLDNLLENAVKFTMQGSITFSAAYGDGHLHVKIKDTGIGMSEETVKKIFNPFEQGAPEVNAGGFGLGLSIVSGVVRLLDGKINVESRLGKGSVFSLTIPLPPTDEQVEDTIQVELKPEDLPQFVIAIEDDPLQLELCREILERNGVRCTACIQAEQLVEKMRKHDYDLLLTDIQMPGMDGFNLLKLLRGSDIGNSRAIPVVAMTARGEYDTDKLLEAGFSGCVYKPFSSKELLPVISRHYQSAQKQQTIDFSPILEDVQDAGNILRMLVTETHKNMESLNLALKTSDRGLLRRTIHRMFPMWEMLRMESVLKNCRKVLAEPGMDGKKMEEQVIRVLTACRKLTDEAEQKLNEYEKDTDC